MKYLKIGIAIANDMYAYLSKKPYEEVSVFLRHLEDAYIAQSSKPKELDQQVEETVKEAVEDQEYIKKLAKAHGVDDEDIS